MPKITDTVAANEKFEIKASKTNNVGRLLTILAIVCSIVLMMYFTSNMIDLTSTKEELNVSDSIPCSVLNVSDLRLITFDLFGALMLTESSLNHTIGQLLPSLKSSDVENFAKDWLQAYRSFFGQSFPPSLTHQPFLWVIRSSLLKILESFNLSTTVPEGSSTFNSLISAWGNLQPREGAVTVLSKLSRKYPLALLSNGDSGTLRAALRVFPASVNFSLILSSDYPINCFKACSSMYAQALAAVGGDPRRVFHVAGSKYDAQGARNFGPFSGILQRLIVNVDPEPCFTFDDIAQLLSFFNV